MKKYRYEDELHSVSTVTLDAFIGAFRGDKLDAMPMYEENEGEEESEWEEMDGELEEDLEDL